jgi:hypothetical protein
VAFVVATFSLALRVVPFGFFFGFDFLAEFFVFGVFGFAAFVFAFVVDFFDLNRFVFTLIVGFARLGFFFVVPMADEERSRRGGKRGRSVSRGGRGEQQERSEQEDQQDREFPHGSLIGASRPAV